jgi:hypothetical protein
MNGILQLVGRRLVGLCRAFSIPLQVDVHFADAVDVSGLGVVSELVAVDLVKAVVRLAIDNDVDVL